MLLSVIALALQAGSSSPILPPSGNRAGTPPSPAPAVVTPAPATPQGAPSDAAPEAGGEARRALRIGVGDLSVSGVPEATRDVFEEALVVELRKLQRVSVISWSEIQEMLDLEANKQMLGCSDDKSCLAEIADAAGVDVLVVGSLASIGTDSVLSLTRIDQAKAAVDAKAQKRLVPDDGREWLAAVGPIVEELFADVPLRPGAVRGVDDALVTRLHPPPLPAFVPFALGATTGALLLSTVGALLFWQVQQSDYRTLVTTPGAKANDVTQKGAAVQLTEGVMWGVAGGTLAGGLLTALSVPFTHFEGDDEVAR